MKKVISLFLAVALVVTAMIMPVSAATPAGAYLNVETGEYEADTGVVSAVYADINFDDATFDFSEYYTEGALNIPATSYVPVFTTNAVETDKVISITAATNKNTITNTVAEIPSGSLQYIYHPKEIGTNEDGSTNYAFGDANRKQSAKFKFTIAEGVTGGENELVYFDFKMKRNAVGGGEDNGSIYLKDSSSNNITTFYFGNSKEMRVSAYGVNYGGDLTSNAPYSTDWKQYRMIMDFSKKTFELYVGDDISTLKPYISTVESYTMQSNKATNFALLEDTDKPSFTFDDFKVYTVKPPVAPVASEVTMAGKPNLGATLTMTYGSYACEGDIAEGDSYCYWEASDDSTFVSATKLTDDIPVKAGETNEYVLTDAETGKYVRCVVIPVNEPGVEGAKAYSNATEYKVNDITVTLSVTGNIKWGTDWDYKGNTNNYGAKVSVVSTLSESKEYTLIGAWYVNETDAETSKKLQRLVSVKALPVPVGAANETETGSVSTSFSTDTVYSVPKNGDGNENTIKVMLVDSLSTMTPACNYVYAGTNF